MGESFVRPTANVETQPAGDVNAAQNADIGITAKNGSAAAAAAVCRICRSHLLLHLWRTRSLGRHAT